MSITAMQKQLDEITIQLRKARDEHEIEKQEFIKQFKAFRQVQEKKYVDLQVYCLKRMLSMLSVISSNKNLINKLNQAVSAAQGKQTKQSSDIMENLDLINQIHLLKQQLEQTKVELTNKNQVLQQKEGQIDDLLQKLKKAKQKLKSKGLNEDLDDNHRSDSGGLLKMEDFVTRSPVGDQSQPYTPSHARLKATFHIRDTTQSILRIANEYNEQKIASEYKKLRKSIASNAAQLQSAHNKQVQIAKRAQSLQQITKSASFRKYQDKMNASTTLRQSSSLKRNNSNNLMNGETQWQHKSNDYGIYSSKQNKIVGDELDHNQIVVTVKDWNPLDYNLTQNPVITDVLETGHAQFVKKQPKFTPDDLRIQDLVQQTFESFYQQNVIPYIFDLQESYVRAIKLLGK